MTRLLRSLPIVVFAAIAITVAACKGPGGTSTAPGGFPPVNPSGDRAQYVAVGDVGTSCLGSTSTSSVLFYLLGTNTVPLSGNLTPSLYLNGTHTQLNYPDGLFIDNNGNIWVSSFNAHAVQEYAAAPTPKPTAAPSRTITDTLDPVALSGPTGVYVQQNASGVNTYVYVADFTNNAIDIFAATASGNSHYVSQISGSNTTLSQASGLVLDSSGNIWVGNRGKGEVVEFPGEASLAAGVNNIAPMKTIGPVGTTGLTEPSGVYFDRTGDLWVADQEKNSISEFAASVVTGSSSYTGAPIVTIAGGATGIAAPFSVAIDSGGNVYEVGFSSPLVNIWMANQLAPGTNNIASTYSIAGPSTDLVCPAAIQVYSVSGTNDI